MPKFKSLEEAAQLTIEQRVNVRNMEIQSERMTAAQLREALLSCYQGFLLQQNTTAFLASELASQGRSFNPAEKRRSPQLPKLPPKY